MHRRNMLKLTAASLATAVAGCSESENPDYENGNESGNSSDNGTVELVEHDLVEEEKSYGTEYYVRGIVRNTDGEMYDYVEVNVRTFDGEDRQLDTYLANTTDLSGNSEWQFEVMLIDGEFERYDIAVDGDQY